MNELLIDIVGIIGFWVNVQIGIELWKMALTRSIAVFCWDENENGVNYIFEWVNAIFNLHCSDCEKLFCHFLQVLQMFAHLCPFLDILGGKTEEKWFIFAGLNLKCWVICWEIYQDVSEFFLSNWSGIRHCNTSFC